jgi:membrane-bound serine protease (ClpP class)
MNDPDFEMEASLRDLAARSGTPPLPPETAELPWSVQRNEPRTESHRFLPALRGAAGGAGRGVFTIARLAATVAIAGSLLIVLGQVRGGTPNSANNIIVPLPTPRASIGASAPTGGPEVVVLPTSGVVDDVMASYIQGGIARAQSDGAVAVIVQLDTLGGSLTSMTAIVTDLNASIPTIVWVGPAGAKAASAGTFITMSANLAYMAPSTNIGAASPVAAGGGDIATQFGQTEADKVLQDAEASMRGYTQAHHPQAVDWAVSTVSSAKSYSAQEALAAHGINGIASSLDDVLAQADGQVVNVKGASVTLHTKGATLVTVAEDPVQLVLHSLDDPNIAFILLVLGVLCVLVEFFHPTLLVGLLGALSIALSFYGSGSLPLNVLGVVLVVLGIGMLAIEPAVPSHGLLTLGGVVCFIVGAVAFYGSPGPYLPRVSVAWPIILTSAALASVYGLVFVRTVLQMRRIPIPVGSGMVGTVVLVGAVGEVRQDLTPVGSIYVSRESWTAKLEGSSSAPRGSRVKVIRQEGLTLFVERLPGDNEVADS